MSQFERELPAQQFNTWIKALRCEDDKGEPSEAPRRLRVLAPNRFVLQWVRERYMNKIETLSREFYGEPVDASLGLCEVLKSEPGADAEEENAVPAPVVAPLPISSSRNHLWRPVLRQDAPKRRFHLPYPGDRSRHDLARAAAQQVAMNPGT